MPLAAVVTQKASFVDILAHFWPVALVSFVVALVATPLCRKIALKKRIVDNPDNFLKPHKQPIPYLGGVAIFLGWFIGILAFLIMHTNAPPEFRVRASVMVGVAVAGLAIMLVGLFDDLSVMNPKPKLVANILVALFLVWLGLGDQIIYVIGRVMGIELPFWLELVYSVPITVFIVVGACNATNLIDGLDGLCTGVLGIISLGFFILAAHLRQYGDSPLANERIVLTLAMLGAAGGFLPFNRNPAKIFMGDAGSMLLGLNAATIMLMFGEEHMIGWMIGALMVFGLPVADMMLAMVRRWRNGRPVMKGDRSHFYDQLVDRGLSVRRVVTISYLLTIGFVLVGTSVILLRIRYAVLVFMATGALVLFGIWKMNMAGIEPDRRPDNDDNRRPESTVQARGVQ